MFIQNIISNKFDLNWSTSFSYITYDHNMFIVEATVYFMSIFSIPPFGTNMKSKNIEWTSKEVLLNGTAHHGWPPCTCYFRSALFNNEDTIYIF